MKINMFYTFLHNIYVCHFSCIFYRSDAYVYEVDVNIYSGIFTIQKVFFLNQCDTNSKQQSEKGIGRAAHHHQRHRRRHRQQRTQYITERKSVRNGL